MTSSPPDQAAAPRRPRPATLALTALRWSLSLLALGYLARFVLDNIDQLRGSELTLRWGWLVASFLVSLLYLLLRGLVWHDMTRRNGVAIPLPRALISWNYSILGKYLPGKVFLLLGRLVEYDRYGRSKAKVTFTFFQETVTSLLSSVVTILLALLTADLPYVRGYRGLLIGVILVVAVGMHPRVMQAVLDPVLRLLRRPAVRLELGYADVLRFTVEQTLAWFVFGVAFYLFINALYGVDVRLILYLAAAISFASMIGILALFAPSGLGVREGILALLLADVMPAPAAALIALSSRLWVTASEGLAIATAAILAGRGRSPRSRLLDARPTDPEPVPTAE